MTNSIEGDKRKLGKTQITSYLCPHSTQPSAMHLARWMCLGNHRHTGVLVCWFTSDLCIAKVEGPLSALFPACQQDLMMQLIALFSLMLATWAWFVLYLTDCSFSQLLTLDCSRVHSWSEPHICPLVILSNLIIWITFMCWWIPSLCLLLDFWIQTLSNILEDLGRDGRVGKPWAHLHSQAHQNHKYLQSNYWSSRKDHLQEKL